MEALYAEYGGRIYRFCHRLSGNPSDAEDLTQEVFLAAYRGMEGFQGRASVQTWLFRIAVFRWRAMRRTELPSLGEENWTEASAPDPAIAGTDRISMDGAMASIPSLFREAFLLVKLEGLTCREAAEALGVPQGTVKFRVYRATHLLRGLLRAEGWEPGLTARPAGKETCDEV
ncbi:hypothetical protein CCAX7_16830 [Capsulimonas corticalis]|uniref:RNA polymerase sigma factor n=1 Tax=Capsulimonas corticalis TaxID=2219043 RepID=A0A402CYU3_9BACT|nr:hypothetical protein CCAX7_16830 [Capsulimonas corticalis]